MIRAITALLGLTIIGAVFAGIHYADGNAELRRNATPFNLAPGEVQDDFIEPSVPGGPITVEITVTLGTVDIYIMDREWEDHVLDSQNKVLNLSKPFSYHKQWSKIGVNGTYTFSLIGDGEKRYAILIDNSDNYYDNDTVPDTRGPGGGAANIRIETRYLAEETKSLVWGFIAATPSIILVIYTLGRQVKRWRREKQDAATAKQVPTENP